MRFSVLASGSKGNSCYVETENARILLDAGLSGREIEHRLELVGASAANLDAIVITHEHSDHIKGAGVLSRRFNLPLYINRKTLERGLKVLGKLPSTEIFETGQTLKIKDLSVETFTKCHDASDPVGLILSSEGAKIGVVTDLGKSTRLVEDRLKGCRALIIEFNHDLEILEKGPYPLYLKRRITGRDGHLSNEQGAVLLNAISSEILEKVVLAHISEVNNNPDKAFKQANDVLTRCGLSQTEILVGHQDVPGPVIDLK